MKNVLYRPSWQKLRVSCLSVNHPNGGFTTTEGTRDNLLRLNAYCFEDPGGQQGEAAAMGWGADAGPMEQACRVWRVLNLCNATRMGYSGQHQQGTEMDEAVRVYRDSLQPHYSGSVVTRAGDAWKWDVVQYELETLWREERYWFQAIKDDLSRRKRVSSRSQDITGTRADLLQFLQLMEAVNLH